MDYNFVYTVDANADVPKMLLLKHLGNDAQLGYGINGEMFAKELYQLESMGKSRVEILINSVGGTVMDGYAILSAMLRVKCSVDTINCGMAASTAGWIFQGGKERKMYDYAIWMGHNPYIPNGSSAKELLSRFRDSICSIISRRTGKSDSDIYAMLDKETFLNATECQNLGFCDTVIQSDKVNVKRATPSKVTNMNEAVSFYNQCLEITNSILNINSNKSNNNNKNNMEATKLSIDVLNALNLPEAASDVMVKDAISTLQNKLTAAEQNLLEASNKAKMSDEEMARMKTKCANLEKQLDDIKKQMEGEELENLTNLAKEMVNKAETDGKIKADTVDSWVNMALIGATNADKKEQLEKVKNMLESLPTNKTAKVIQVVNTSNTPMYSGEAGAAALMASIAQGINNNK